MLPDQETVTCHYTQPHLECGVGTCQVCSRRPHEALVSADAGAKFRVPVAVQSVRFASMVPVVQLDPFRMKILPQESCNFI